MSTAALSPQRSRQARTKRTQPEAAAEQAQPANSFVLRGHAFRDLRRIDVTLSGPECRLDVIADASLLRGHWAAELTVDGQGLAPHGPWEETLRYEDEDVDYLELETILSPEWSLERHVLLARKEGFVLLADAVLGQKVSTISYVSRIPIGDGVQFRSEAETHEGWLTNGKQRRLVLPLALPEWRSDRPLGALSAADEQLTLTTNAARRRRLFQAVLIPLVSARRKLDYTWRPLTVAEDLVIQSSDNAAGYRVQVGDRQWVVYRALTRGNRTFLGKNLTSELFVGVFHRTGQMDAIMEIE